MPALIHQAFEAAATLLPPHLGEEFLLVGGAALLWWSSLRLTQDLDIAASSATILASYEQLLSSPAFTCFEAAG